MEHLDHCLLCRCCERVCPSGVTYGRMMDETRQWLTQKNIATNWLTGLGLKILTDRSLQHIAFTILRLYQRSGLPRLFRYSGLLHLFRLNHAAGILPKLSKPIPIHSENPANGTNRGRVALFTGCLAPGLDQNTIHSSIKILNRLGYEVHLPLKQTCCGALHLHQGEAQQACKLAGQNIEAFKGETQVVYLATGCGSFLNEYANLPWQDDKQTNSAKSPIQQAVEISDFINRHDLGDLPLAPLDTAVAVHSPCSEANSEAIYQLLGYIPGIKLVPILKNGCCGAAGSYMLTQPTLAKQIRNKTTSQIAASSASLIATTNIGCAIHIKEGLPSSARILHPVELLAMQLE